MTWEGWLTLGVVAGVFVVLVRSIASPDMVMLSAVVFLGLTGVLSPEEVFEGLVNPGVIAIGALFVVAAGMSETGALDVVGGKLLGSAKSEVGVLLRLAATVIPTSAFLNNTPVVAMLVPVIGGWCRKNQVSPSRLLIPLSYLAILGGACTLIGTSTIIVVNGLVEDAGHRYAALATEGGVLAATYESAARNLHAIGMFEVTWLGLPLCFVGVLYLLTLGRRLLPDRHDLLEQHGESARSYLINMEIKPGCRLAGQTVQAAGLRRLPGLFLVEVVRDDVAITPVRPDEVLREGDILTFTGVVSTIVDLERIPGLVPVADENYITRAAERREKGLCEAVISATSPLIRKNVRDADFRARYNAAIVAIHRGGQRLTGRVGDIVLRHGDTLLLQTGPHFVRAHQNSPDFYLVGGVKESRATRNDRAPLAVGLLLLLVLMLSTTGITGIAVHVSAAMVALLMIGTHCTSAGQAMKSVDWRMLLTIGAAIGLGHALEKTGAAAQLAGFLTAATHGQHPVLTLATIYILTGALTECITTKGSAVLMFPIAVETALQLDVSPRPFAMAVLFAATVSVVTPLGYQTNLMVFGPGGYKFGDFIRTGLPLAACLVIVAVTLIPLIWPF